MPRPPTTYTFVTVNDDCTEWDSHNFSKLREGILHFLREYHDDDMVPAEYVLLGDAQLMEEVLRLGKENRDEARDFGLVGIIKTSPSVSGLVVYLEMSPKHGDWNLCQDSSIYLERTRARIAWELAENGGNMTQQEVMDAAFERSREDALEERGWGVVETFQGQLIAIGDDERWI